MRKILFTPPGSSRMYVEYLRLLATLAHAVTAIFLLTVGYTTTCPHLVSVSFYSGYYAGEANSFAVATPPSSCPRETTNLTALGFPTGYWRDMWCQAMAVPLVWDVQQDPQTFTPGGGWNLLVMAVVFEWVAAGWALLYTTEPSGAWRALNEWLDATAPGLVVQPLAATVWNLVLLVILWFSRSQLQVPDNNLFVFTVVLLVTIMKQNFVAMEPTTEEPVSPHTTPRELWTEHFIDPRRRAPPLHDAKYQQAIAEDPVSRLLQYATLAPTVLVLVLNCITRTGSTWTYQVTLMAMASCLSISPVLHYTTASGHKTAGKLTVLVCALTYLSAFTVVVYTAWNYLFQPSAGLAVWGFGLTWFVIIAYCLFGILTTVHYLPTLLWDEALEASPVPLAFCFDHMCLVVTLVVSWVLYSQWLAVCQGQC